MTLTRLRTRAYAAGLAAVVLLAGCSDGDGQGGGSSRPADTSPAATTPSSTGATPSTSSAAVDPVLARIPAAARPETREGAEAFARFFIGQVNRAWSGAEADAMKGFYADSCKVCIAFAESAERMESEGRRHKGDTLTVGDVSTISFVNPHKEIRVEATQNSVPVLDEAGQRVDTTKADSGSFVLTLAFDRHWTVERLQAVQK